MLVSMQTQAPVPAAPAVVLALMLVPAMSPNEVFTVYKNTKRERVRTSQAPLERLEQLFRVEGQAGDGH